MKQAPLLLHGLALYRRPLSFSPVTDCGDLYQLFPSSGNCRRLSFLSLALCGAGVWGAMASISSNHHLCSPLGKQTVLTSQEIQNWLDCWQPWRNWGGHKNQLFSSLEAADNRQGFFIHSLCTGQGEGLWHPLAQAAVSFFPKQLTVPGPLELQDWQDKS